MLLVSISYGVSGLFRRYANFKPGVSLRAFQSPTEVTVYFVSHPPFLCKVVGLWPLQRESQ